MDLVRYEREAMSPRTIPRRRGASLPRWGGWCVMLVVSLSEPARAQEPSCSDGRIRIEGPLDAAWARAALELCETLSTLPDLDPQILVRIVSSRPGVILEASLPDGRTALRRVHAPADLRPTLEALATVPPAPKQPPAPPTPTRAADPAPVVARAATPASSSPPPSPPRPAPALGFELGLSADSRLEGGPAHVSVGPAAYVGLRPGAWMLALQLRWQAAQTVLREAPRGLEMSTVALSVLAAHRFRLKPAVHFDLGVSTSMLVQTQEYKPHGGDEDDEVGASTVDARLGPLARLIVGRGAWRAFFALDADLSPVRVRHAFRLDASTPYFPTFGLGLNLGACWGWGEP